MRRLQGVDLLPRRDQDALMRTIDAFLARAPAEPSHEEDEQAA